MNDRTTRGQSFFRAYATVATTVAVVLSLAAFKQANEKPRFQEIDVERINIVEKDGRLRLVISNKERAPDGVIDGKTHKRQGGNTAGMIFYNEEGDENGGLLIRGETVNGRGSATGALLFDRYNQDQTVGIMYSEDSGRWTSGFHVWDRPDNISLGDPRYDALDRSNPVRRERALKEMGDQGLLGARRVFVGRSDDATAVVRLADSKGRPRLRLVVDATGSPRLEFLDETGRVTRTLNDAAEPRKR